MGRRWIVAGLLLVALVTTLAVLVLGRAEAPLPDPCWCCVATGEVRATPQGETLSALRFMMIGAPDLQHDGAHLRGGIHRAPTFAERVTAWFHGGGFKLRLFQVHGGDTVEIADGRPWVKFELEPPLAPSPR